MSIRPIDRTELDRFVAFTGDDAENERFGADVDRALRANETSPSWCLIATDGDATIGRAFLLHRAGNPVFIHLFDLEWSRPDWRAVGSDLIGAVVVAAQESDERSLLYALDSPHPSHSEPERRAELFTAAGFQRARVGQRWQRRIDATASVATPSRLEFRTLAEAGEDRFKAAIALVSDGTLDERLREMRRRLGRTADADEHFHLLMGIPHEPGWWQLAYSVDGGLVGLIVGGGNSDEPVIAYVGVVPEQRGRGYVDDLLVQAVATLTDAGASVIRADTDLANVPMANAFRRAGFEQFLARTEYLYRPT
jgi:RimJ/RimL family protein N-acetyltransferase